MRVTEDRGSPPSTGAGRNDAGQAFPVKHMRKDENEAMKSDVNARAGGNAQSKGIDDEQEPEAGVYAETEDADEEQDAQRAGGDAQSKGIS